jgi:hypothetical protein
MPETRTNPFAALAEPDSGLLIQHPIFPGASSTTAVLETSGPDDETCHIPCCADVDLAICGTDVAGMRWSRLPVTCAVCMDLDSTSVGACWTACPKRRGARP